jgi:hypothetical protein
MRERWRRRVLVLVLVMCSAGVAFAQQPFGTIVGTVTDATDAMLSAVTITVTNVETQVRQTLASSATGDYSVSCLEVRSAMGFGTEIELRIPAAIAYGVSARPWWLRLFARTNSHA